jgi:hypothetical protein
MNKEEFLKKSMCELKKIAWSYNIKNLQQYKKDNKEQLITLILIRYNNRNIVLKKISENFNL